MPRRSCKQLRHLHQPPHLLIMARMATAGAVALSAGSLLTFVAPKAQQVGGNF